MPKKIQHKGKLKSAVEESEDIPFVNKSNENIEEDYTTVVDFESSKKYNRRLIRNNWSKYESAITEFENSDDANQLPETDDFSNLLKTASSDCSHFQFSSEKQWTIENTLPASEIFSLDLSVLSSGLACVPFYERISLDESQLSVQDKMRFDREAEENLKEYTLMREKNKKERSDDDVKVDEPTRVEVVLDGGDVKHVGEDNLEELQSTRNNEANTVPLNVKKVLFSENEENLEDWLDSVLDD